MMTQAPPPDVAAGDGGKVESVNIRSAENGGFIVSCSKTKDVSSGGQNQSVSGRDYQSKDYAFTSLGEVQNYLASEFGGGTPAEMPVDDVDAGADEGLI